MAAAKPWMKFYPRDWRADEKLRECSLAARGLWIEMLSIMHASERYGRLLVAGKAPSAASLGRQVGASATEIEGLLEELREADVFSVDANGIIYSRRMKSDEKSAENARKNGRRGGNPKLCKQTENAPPDKGSDKGGDKTPLKLRGQRPEKKESIEKRPRTVPDGWVPEAFGVGTEAEAIASTWSTAERTRQVEAFTDHHRSHGSKFVDWQAAWGTWTRNSARFAQRDAARPAPKGSVDPHDSRSLVKSILEERGLKSGVGR